MALFESFMVPCARMGRTRVPDGEGGWRTEWAEGAPFDAAIVLESAAVALIAEAQGATGLFTVTARRGTGLRFHDAFKRLSDGATFRVTKVCDPTPDAASFAFDQYQAERWDLA